MTILGVDVASYQSETFSTSGLSFAFTKASEGTSYVNPRMTGQAAHARSAGLVVGFYHFLKPGNVKEQAAYFVSKAASQAGDVLACDWEPTNAGLATNAEKDDFIKEVKRLRPDHRVILYCDTSRWKNVDRTGYCGDGLWIADPNHAAGHPGIQSAWLIHQYSESGGIDHNVGNFADKAAMVTWAKALISGNPSNGGTVTAYDDVMKADRVPVDKSLDKDGTWTPETAMAYLVQSALDAKAAMAKLQAQVAANGATLSAIQAALKSLDPAKIEADLVAKIKSLSITVTEKS